MIKKIKDFLCRINIHILSLEYDNPPEMYKNLDVNLLPYGDSTFGSYKCKNCGKDL